MDKVFKYILGGMVAIVICGIFYATSLPKPALSLNEEMNLINSIIQSNSELPRKIGTIGTLDSIKYDNHTLTYIMSVSGGEETKKLYDSHYNEFGDLIKYTFIIMNGQNNMGSKYANGLKSNQLNIRYKIYTSDKQFISWTFTGKEIYDFITSCKINPSTALKKSIDMQIAIANINLPVCLEDLQSDVKSIALNSFIGGIDESFLPHSISHVGDDIIFEYNVNETVYDFPSLNESYAHDEVKEEFVKEMTEDADVLEFYGLIVMSRSNMIIRLTGRQSGNVLEITIPYEMLKRHCKIPKHFLS